MPTTPFRHGGYHPQLWTSGAADQAAGLDFSANINPLGLPDWLRPLISSTLETLVHYPDPTCSELVAAICESYSVAADEVLVGNGTSELIYLLPRTRLFRRAVIPVPCYVDYQVACEAGGLTRETHIMTEAEGFALNIETLGKKLRPADLVFIGQPNNPTGLMVPPSKLRELAQAHPQTTFAVDEAFIGFIPDADTLLRHRPPNVLVLCSMTKLFAVPGLRLGWAAGAPALMRAMQRLQPCWAVNTLAQRVGVAALKDGDYVARSQVYVAEERDWLSRQLQRLKHFRVYSGLANYLLVKVTGGPYHGTELAERLLQHGIAVRTCHNIDGLNRHFIRLAVRSRSDNERLIEALQQILNIPVFSKPSKLPPALMIQGTASNAGKSVLVAAFGRILQQDGYRVAPFKAQNMSLNSFVTLDGGEMGRAQVVQARACGLEPDVRMNPVLLKPSSDTGSQVIVNGRPVSNMDVGTYIAFKAELLETVQATYTSLAGEHEVMVLEGAGSPAEVNLKRHDIVNLTMARHARAAVLLTGDIDRGGVFAAFVGTLEVLAEWERALIKGFIVNRFRGQASLLEDALTYIQRHTRRPVLGVVPWMPDLGLPEEDSVSFKGGVWDDQRRAEQMLEIALIDLPHISNFTDFEPLRLEPDIYLKRVTRPEELQQPDVVILPGSKNVIGDMQYLVRRGLKPAIEKLAARGCEIVGICGGFQMLGRQLQDPHHLESATSQFNGLELLDLDTTLAPAKTLIRVTARHKASGLPVKGYEIHHGQTTSRHEPLLITSTGQPDGACSPDGRIWGTYLHGIFENDAWRHWWIGRLRQRRNLPSYTIDGPGRAVYDLEPALDRLADVVRQGVDVGRIYQMMGL